MSNLDWTKFNKRVSISSDIDEIFNAWMTQDNFEKWFLSKAEFKNDQGKLKGRNAKIGNGDRYLWMWHGSENVVEGEVIETNDKDFLRFSFLGCVVEMSIKIEDGENLIELTQSEIALDEESRMNYYVGCSRGWTFFLTNLKSILEGGIDLRNRNKNLVDVINT